MDSVDFLCSMSELWDDNCYPHNVAITRLPAEAGSIYEAFTASLFTHFIHSWLVFGVLRETRVKVILLEKGLSKMTM
jgi:hypothetical protein